MRLEVLPRVGGLILDDLLGGAVFIVYVADPTHLCAWAYQTKRLGLKTSLLADPRSSRQIELVKRFLKQCTDEVIPNFPTIKEAEIKFLDKLQHVDPIVSDETRHYGEEQRARDSK